MCLSLDLRRLALQALPITTASMMASPARPRSGTGRVPGVGCWRARLEPYRHHQEQCAVWGIAAARELVTQRHQVPFALQHRVTMLGADQRPPSRKSAAGRARLRAATSVRTLDVAPFTVAARNLELRLRDQSLSCPGPFEYFRTAQVPPAR